jgi:hypothetical protein
MLGREIVKVQLSLYTSPGATQMALVYAKGRVKMKQIHITEVLQAKMKSRPKAFFWANYRDGNWNIYDEAPDQNW